AWANWRLTMAHLEQDFRCVAPDLAGFGYTPVPADWKFTRDTWLGQMVAFLDALDLDRVHVIGNSFGGAMALALALAYPERVDRLVLMGSVGVDFELTHGLDLVWGHKPSLAKMRDVMDVFAFDSSLISDDLIALRHKASCRPEVAEAYARMFPAPRQRWVEALAIAPEQIATIPHETLIVHGREDRVIPLSNSLKLLESIDRSRLHVFGRCGHWTQVEKADEFNALVRDFLGRADCGQA
ncbi:MAG: alpha/beta fold hydrolase, partial [Pontixanthobacter sp.]